MDTNDLNIEFSGRGWKVLKELTSFDGEFLSEDLAQYKKGDTVVDFGFYGDGCEPAKGEYRIYMLKNDDWENWTAKLLFADRSTAVNFLNYISRMNVSD